MGLAFKSDLSCTGDLTWTCLELVFSMTQTQLMTQNHPTTPPPFLDFELGLEDLPTSPTLIDFTKEVYFIKSKK